MFITNIYSGDWVVAEKMEVKHKYLKILLNRTWHVFE